MALMFAACSAEPGPAPALPGAEKPPIPVEDLVPEDNGKGDGATFDKHNIISDTTLTDATFLTVVQVQGFLEATPYGKRSVLADYSVDGVLASEIIADAALRYGISPLVLLTKLQVESSLIFAETATTYRLRHAMGCACPDGAACAASESGFASQLDCAARLFRKYVDAIAEDGQTISGWAPGKTHQTLDHESVTPKNAATAALYTYTPWVLRGTGGNWLFWNVFRKYSRHVTKATPNHHWIGGPCTNDVACSYDEGSCLVGLSGAGGFCSKPCWKFCPDTLAPNTTVTFCTDLGTAIHGAPAGYCVARCNTEVFPDTGCAEGFACSSAERYGQAGVFKDVCWPSAH